MSAENPVRIPTFFHNIEIARRQALEATQQFVSENPIHEQCDSHRSVVAADLEIPVDEVDNGFQAVLCVHGVAAIECGCHTVSTEKETHMQTPLLELAPGVSQLITDRFNEERGAEFSFGQPIFILRPPRIK